MDFSDSALVRYYAAVDAGDYDTALSYVDPSVEIAMYLPGSASHRSGHAGLLDYLTGRGDVDRRHVPLRVSVLEDLEFIAGAVLEDGATTTGHFLGAVSKSADGLITRYQVVFDTDFCLLP